MKQKPIIAASILAAALTITLSVPSVDAHAQGRRSRTGGPGNQSGQFNNQGGSGQGTLSPADVNAVMVATGSTNNILDPARSYKATLVYRPEVQNALALDLKQKNALDALKDNQAQDQQKIAADVRTMMMSRRTQQGQAADPNQPQTPVDPEQQKQELTDKLKGIIQGYQGDQLKRIDAILTPKQRQRLTEIDLRWRGPVALVDPQVAEQAQLGADDKKKAQDAYKEFQDARQKLMGAMLPGGAPFQSNAAGASAAASPTTAPLTLQDRQAAQRKALTDFDKSRATIGTKLISTVTPPAATTWETMIGAPFTFRDINQ